MAITDLGPIVTHEGSGMSRQGTTSVARNRKAVRRLTGVKVRRLKSRKKVVKGRTVQESENNPNVAGYHTSSVDAPLGYQGQFGPK